MPLFAGTGVTSFPTTIQHPLGSSGNPFHALACERQSPIGTDGAVTKRQLTASEHTKIQLTEIHDGDKAQ